MWGQLQAVEDVVYSIQTIPLFALDISSQIVKPFLTQKPWGRVVIVCIYLLVSGMRIIGTINLSLREVMCLYFQLRNRLVEITHLQVEVTLLYPPSSATLNRNQSQTFTIVGTTSTIARREFANSRCSIDGETDNTITITGRVSGSDVLIVTLSDGTQLQAQITIN